VWRGSYPRPPPAAAARRILWSMSGFQVTTSHLVTAAGLLATDESSGPMPDGGAAASTPAAGAWSDFVAAGAPVVSGAHTAITDLSQSVSLAARIYQMADQQSADSMQVVQ
jgi:hypothetical protein